MPSNHHINPRFRAYGKARIDITRRAKNEDEWQQLWRQPVNSFPFEFSNEWKFCVEYKVDDFAAEVGFYIDILGWTVIAFSPSYAQFTTPEGDFCISVASLREGEKSTPADAIRLQLKVEDILQLVEALEKRGVIFERRPETIQAGSNQAAGYFRTPHGVCVDLWGEITQKPDIHDLLEETEVDEVETDRIIQRLLNLPGKDEPEAEDTFAHNESDDLNAELVDADRSLGVESDTRDTEREPPQDLSDEGNQPSSSPEPAQVSRSQPQRYSGKSINSGRNKASGRSTWDRRGNGELTYHTIDDDPEFPGDDDL